MSDIIEALQSPDTFFKEWFSTETDKAIEKFRKSPFGIEIRNRAIMQEIQDLAKNPLLLVALGVIVLFSIRR